MKVGRLFLISMIPLMALIMRIASTPTANLSYLPLAGFALFGRVQAIQALALSFLFTMINPGIGAETEFASIGRYVVLAAAAGSVFYRFAVKIKFTRLQSTTLATFFLGLFFIIHSFFFSPIVDVSVFKALSWTVAMVTLLSAWFGLGADERELLESQLFGGLILVMLVSLPLLVLPLGYLRNGTGFQGVLNHPQAFGLTMGLLSARLASQIFGQKKPPVAMVALVAMCFVLVVLSQTRTAGLALLLGVGIAVVTVPGLSGRKIRAVLPGLRSRRVHLMLVLGLLGVILSGPLLMPKIDAYLKKGRQTAGLVESYELSRGILIERMVDNIREKPFFGSGFGIASIPATMEIRRDPILGLPFGAAIEKGVAPLAILEELGIIGFAAVAAWGWMLLRRSARGGVAPLAVSITVLLMNMGESTLFSPGGFGLLSLILLAWASASERATKGRQ